MAGPLVLSVALMSAWGSGPGPVSMHGRKEQQLCVLRSGSVAPMQLPPPQSGTTPRRHCSSSQQLSKAKLCRFSHQFNLSNDEAPLFSRLKEISTHGSSDDWTEKKMSFILFMVGAEMAFELLLTDQGMASELA